MRIRQSAQLLGVLRTSADLLSLFYSDMNHLIAPPQEPGIFCHIIGTVNRALTRAFQRAVQSALVHHGHFGVFTSRTVQVSITAM